MDIIAALLTYIINTCINSYGQYISRISPIPEIEVPKCNNDFRSITILPVQSKVYKRLVLKRQLSFAESHLNDNVTGFRRGHLSSTVLIAKRDDIRAMNRER